MGPDPRILTLTLISALHACMNSKLDAELASSSQLQLASLLKDNSCCVLGWCNDHHRLDVPSLTTCGLTPPSYSGLEESMDDMVFHQYPNC